MADLNVCLFVGRLGRDPEVKYLPSGSAACNFSIAVGRKWKDKESGETRDNTVWVPCSAFDKTAELIGKWAKKGSQVRITGEFAVRKYNDKDGNERTITEIKVQDFQMLGDKPQGAGAPAPAPAQRQAAAPAAGDDAPF